MKKYLLFIAFLVGGFAGLGQCPGVYITEQSQIDNFAADYPGCIEFEYIYIYGSSSDIVNLNGLSQIESIIGDFYIHSAPIQNMVGLENLVQVGGDMEIYNNYLLLNCQGLNQLETIGGSLFIGSNDLIQTFAGFDSLTLVGQLNINNNNSILSISGLNNLVQANQLYLNGNLHLENLNGLNSLTSLYGPITISNNESLQTLEGIENLQFFEESLTIYDNEELNSISSLNNSNFSSIDEVNITYNEQLSFCAIVAVCQAITDPDSDIFISLNAAGCDSVLEVAADCNITFNTIQGTIAYDSDNNGCDGNDIPLGNAIIIATHMVSQSTYGTVSDILGNYSFFVPEGEYTVEISPLPTNYVSSPASEQIIFTGIGNTETVDFCLTATSVSNDLKSTLLPLTDARPGFDATYQLIYENVGTTVLSGAVTLQFDDVRQDFVEAVPVPNNVSGNLITWNYTDLLPFQSVSIDIVMYSEEPPINNSDDVLVFEAVINPIGGDANPDDNTHTFEQIVVNSYDPNDKQVVQGEEIYENETDNYLDYIVRFQNTGTADAINVEIIDVLSDNLNWDTFRMLSSSHEYRVEITDGNQVAFIFENINLPPEMTDPEGSNGHVAFQIKPIETIAISDVVENTANIFFDFNPPIITNTVSTTVVDNLSVESFGIDHSVRLFPNPVASNLVIQVAEGINFEKASVYSLLGKKLIETSEPEINMEKLSAGIYFVEVFTDKGKVSKKVIKE